MLRFILMTSNDDGGTTVVRPTPLIGRGPAAAAALPLVSSGFWSEIPSEKTTTSTSSGSLSAAPVRRTNKQQKKSSISHRIIKTKQKRNKKDRSSTLASGPEELEEFYGKNRIIYRVKKKETQKKLRFFRNNCHNLVEPRHVRHRWSIGLMNQQNNHRKI